MPVTHFITHKLEKEAKALGASVVCSESEAFHEEYAAKVMSQLRTIFIGRASKRYGELSTESPQLKGLMRDWLENKQSFVSLTQRITKLFAESLDNTSLEVDGYLAFIAEQLADGDRFYIYLIREKTSVALDDSDGLTQTRFIDFSNTGFSLCLDTSALMQDNSKKYATFSYGRGEKALQNTFVEFSGFTDSVNTEQETQEFLKIVEKYAKQLPEEQANETRSKVVDFCMEQDKYGAAVEFHAISQELDESEPEKFVSFLKQERELSRTSSDGEESGIVVEKTEFIPDRKSLKNYVRYSGKNKDVTLSFSAIALGQDIQFNQESETLLLKNLPTRLLKQLKEELEQNQ